MESVVWAALLFCALFAALLRWHTVKERERRVREAYRFHPPSHGAAEWSTVDDVRKGGLL